MGEMNLIDPIEFEKYDKISDLIYPIGHNCSLRFNVSLSRGYNNRRFYFHKEFEYPTKYEDGPDTLVTIKRDYDYYFSIENNVKPDNADKAFIRIGPQEFYLVKQGLDTAISWFRDKKYEKLYQVKNGNLIISSPVPDTIINGLPMNRYISITAVVLQRGNSSADNEPGVCMFLSNPNNFVLMNVNRLIGLEYILSSFNMPLSAQTMISYVQMPGYGFNRAIMGNENQSYGGVNANIDGRQIPGLIDKVQ